MQKSIFAYGRLSGPHAKIPHLFFFSPISFSSHYNFFYPLLSLRSSLDISLLCSPPPNLHGRQRAATPTRRPAIGCGGRQKASSYATSATTGGEVRSPSAKELLEAGVRVCFFFEIFLHDFFLIFACGPHKHPHANLIFTCRYAIRMEKS